MLNRPLTTPRKKVNLLRSSIWETLEHRRLLSVFTVTTAADSGAGSFRQAITDSNSTPGHDTINFSIGTGGAVQIQPLSLLPTITDEVTIDATTQPGYSNSPLIWLDGSKISTVADGLLITAGNSTVSGLSITNFHRGAAIHLSTNGNNLITSNYLGVQPSGSDPPFQFWNIDGLVLDSDSNTIQNNLLSGNDDAGALINSSHNSFTANRVGTNAAGSAANPNNLYGLKIRTGSDNTIAANTLSGNSSNGLDIRSAGSVLIQNNLIGLDASGSHPLPNHGDGVFIRTSSNVTLSGNVISSNAADGLYIDGSSSILVQQNTMGTDPTGLLSSDSSARSFANTGSGVEVFGDSSNITFDSNRIANNNIDGISLSVSSTASNILIHANTIGTSTRGNGSNGITVNSGSATIDSNFLVGNALDGIDLTDSSVVQNNTISQNAFNGISIFGNGNSIAFNTIDHNATAGIAVYAGVSNSIHANSFFSNAIIDIDLNGDGPTPNDSAGHDGPNLFQNYPVLATATLSSSNLTISGALHSTPSQSFSLDFFQGHTYLGSVTVLTDSNGDASFSATVAASVSGDSFISCTATDSSGNTSEYSAAITMTIINSPKATTTTISSTSASSTYGQSITFTAVVQNATGGTVDFFDGSTLLATVPLDSTGQAAFSTASLSVGAHSFTAVYSGDTDFAPSTSDPFVQTVNPASTTTSLSSSLNSSPFGQSLTFTASVSTSLSQFPTGTITFMDGSTPLGTVPFDSTGIAIFSTSALSVGTHTHTAVYNGDTNFAPSTSSPLLQTVSFAPSSTSLSSTLTASSFGQSITFTASVTSSPSQSPTGTITFMDGSTPLATVALFNGSASLSTASLSVGAHTITAVYSGDSSFASSTSAPMNLMVNAVKVATTTTLTTSVNPAAHHAPVTLTASVAPALPGKITGTVTFMDGSTILTTAPVINGVAVFTTSDLSPGTHTITAIYNGDTNFLSSTSSALSQQINPGPPATPPGHGPKKAAMLKTKTRIKNNHGKGHAYARGHDKHRH